MAAAPLSVGAPLNTILLVLVKVTTKAGHLTCLPSKSQDVFAVLSTVQFLPKRPFCGNVKAMLCPEASMCRSRLLMLCEPSTF